MMKYFFYLGPRPKFDRFTYWEKFDYLAVFWGVAIIGFSGLILWFPTAFTMVLPGWALNAAYIVHSDEALLATGFIFLFHFFHTHLRPEAFPMDPVIFTGRMPLERFKDERPLEYERLVAAGQAGRLPRAAAHGRRAAACVYLRLHGADDRCHPGRSSSSGGCSRTASTDGTLNRQQRAATPATWSRQRWFTTSSRSSPATGSAWWARSSRSSRW